MRRAERGFFHPKNPLLRYVVLQVGFVVLAFGIGGFAGALLFVFQAFFCCLVAGIDQLCCALRVDAQTFG